MNALDKPLFDKYGYFLEELPEDCIRDCFSPGQDASEAVSYWRKRLGFQVPRELAVRYLREYGAWEDLDTASDDMLADRCLWLAAGDIKENGEWFGLVH